MKIYIIMQTRVDPKQRNASCGPVCAFAGDYSARKKLAELNNSPATWPSAGAVYWIEETDLSPSPETRAIVAGDGPRPWTPHVQEKVS